MIRKGSPINDGSMKEDVVQDDEELQVHVHCSLQCIFHRSLWSISSVAKLEHYTLQVFYLAIWHFVTLALCKFIKNTQQR